MINRNPHFATLSALIDDYHITMRVERPGVPQKPESEHRICIDQIYSYAALHGFDGSFVDGLMDLSEKKHVLS